MITVKQYSVIYLKFARKIDLKHFLQKKQKKKKPQTKTVTMLDNRYFLTGDHFIMYTTVYKNITLRIGDTACYAKCKRLSQRLRIDISKLY